MPDHGLLLGTRDDDHPQYYNAARLSSWWSGRPPNAHTHLVADVTDIGTYYSAVGHSHVEADITDLGVYALDGHTHSQYSLTSHDHSGVYSPTSHTHSYLPLTGGTLSGPVFFPSGTAGTPSVQVGETDVGLYRYTTNQLGFAASGENVGVMSWDGSNRWLYTDVIWLGNEIQAGSGGAGDPTYAFYDEQTLGWYRYSAGMMSLSIGTSRSYTFTGSGLYLQGAKRIEWDTAGAGVAYLAEGYGIRAYGDATHPFQVLAPLLQGITATGGTYTNGYMYHAPPTTTGSTKSAHWALAAGSVYYMMRDSSSRRWKRDIETWVPDWDLEDLRFVRYVGSKGVPRLGPDNQPIRDEYGAPIFDREWDDHFSVGLIAEEADEVHPALAGRDAEGIPDGIVWDVVISRTALEVLDLKRKVVELERRIAA